MAVCCDLEVDINGEETFMVNKVILYYFGRKLLFLDLQYVFLAL